MTFAVRRILGSRLHEQPVPIPWRVYLRVRAEDVDRLQDNAIMFPKLRVAGDGPAAVVSFNIEATRGAIAERVARRRCDSLKIPVIAVRSVEA